MGRGKLSGALRKQRRKTVQEEAVYCIRRSARGMGGSGQRDAWEAGTERCAGWRSMSLCGKPGANA